MMAQKNSAFGVDWKASRSHSVTNAAAATDTTAATQRTTVGDQHRHGEPTVFKPWFPV
jgi:hypothetical protein